MFAGQGNLRQAGFTLLTSRDAASSDWFAQERRARRLWCEGRRQAPLDVPGALKQRQRQRRLTDLDGVAAERRFPIAATQVRTQEPEVEFSLSFPREGRVHSFNVKGFLFAGRLTAASLDLQATAETDV